MIVFTIKELKTTTNTALNARQKWHLLLQMSLQEYLHKKLQAEQQPFDCIRGFSCLTSPSEARLPKFVALSDLSVALTFHF